MVPGDVNADLFRAVGCILRPVGRGQVLAHSVLNGRWELLDPSSAQALVHCRLFRSLNEHAVEICRTLGLPPDRAPGVSEVLKRLDASGLLASRSRLLGSRAEGPPEPAPPPVTTFAIVTRSRPSLLERSLSSFIANHVEFGRDVRYVVADDGRSEDEGKQVEALLQSLHRRYSRRIHYGGFREKSRFASELCSFGGFNPSTVSFGLGLGSQAANAPGSNRNAILLNTVGELWAGADDDMVCSFASAAEEDDARSVVSLDSRPDCTEFWFFPDRSSLLAAVRPRVADHLGLHESLLGRRIRSRGLGPAGSSLLPDLADDRLLISLAKGTGRVRLTQTGVHGDSALGTPAWLLWINDPSRNRLTRSEPDYRRACVSREVIRQATTPAVSNGLCFMTGSAGFDHRELLPPFMPIYRSEDEVFWSIVRKCYDGDAVGHLPRTVLHDPPDPRRYESNGIWGSACAVTHRNLVRICLDDVALHPGWDAATKLRKLGTHFRDLGSLEGPEFRNFVRGRLVDQACEWITLAEARIREWTSAPGYWVQDFGRALNQVRDSVRRDDWVVPSDAPEDRSLELTRSFLRSFGELLCIWPDLTAAAVELKLRGRSLTRELTEDVG